MADKIIEYEEILPYIEIHGRIRLTVSFQPLKIISLRASCIRWCMQVFAHVAVISLGPNDLRPTIFDAGEQKGSLRPLY